MHRIRFLAASLVVIAAACSGNDSGTTPVVTGTDDALITSDLANVAADGVAEDVDVMTGMDGSVGNISASMAAPAGAFASLGRSNNFRPGLTGCTFANGSFTCPAVTRNGLTATRTITFFDATGATQSAYDSLLTASIHLVADLSGSVTRGNWTADVSRHRDLTFTGLAGDETTRTVDGTGSETNSDSRVTRRDSTRTYTVTGASVITGVVLPVKSNGGNGFPTAGTITRTYTITVTSGPDSGRTVTRTVTITFDGTSNAVASINGSQFTIDCVAHTATPRG
ncbi:MAG TPA: hypothetical protein VHW65_01145 [Gemmatimonadales bacterium]|nr:hypothetical protein [Gemmatimonadales bacterium]